MRCKHARMFPAFPACQVEDRFSITYAVRPAWGGSSRQAYTLETDQEGPHIIFRYLMVPPGDLRRGIQGRYQIDPTYPTREVRLSPESFLELKDFVHSLKVPVLGGMFYGDDGTYYSLEIEMGASIVEFHWWLYLSPRWADLANIVEALTAPFAEQQP